MPKILVGIVLHLFGVKYAVERSSSLVTGCNRVKKESIVYHVKSSTHQTAVARKLVQAQKEQSVSTPLEKGFQKSDEHVLQKMDKLFRTVFYLVKQERSYSDFCDLLKLQSLNGLELGKSYFSDKAAKEFTTQIADLYFDQIKEGLRNADYFSVFCDGSTDGTEKEKVLVMIKILNDHYPTRIFLSLEEPQNRKASGILAALDNAFSKFGIDNWKEKLIRFCSDGATVNFGSVKGVSALLKSQSHWIISVWCLAHRLELAVKDAFKSTYMDTVIDTLTSIYYFYRGSSKRNREADELAGIMDEHFSKPAKANVTRWLEHKLHAVSKMLRNWPVVVAHLNNYAEDNSNKADDRAKAKGLVKKLCQYKFVFYLYFLMDSLSEISRVSLLFQRDDISVPSAVSILKGVDETLEDMIQNPGIQLADFQRDVTDNGGKFHGEKLQNVVDIQVLTNQVHDIVHSLTDCLKTRFGNLHQDPLFTSCQVFNHKNWPSSESNNVQVQNGVPEIKRIVEHFSTLLGSLDVAAALREWTDLKGHIRRNNHYNGVHPLTVYKRICLMENASNPSYNNIMKIIHLHV